MSKMMKLKKIIMLDNKINIYTDIDNIFNNNDFCLVPVKTFDMLRGGLEKTDVGEIMLNQKDDDKS
jgi:hypothetical protein